jgi:hypothetical protein
MQEVEYIDKEQEIEFTFEVPETPEEVLLKHFQGYISLTNRWKEENPDDKITDQRHGIIILAAISDTKPEDIEKMRVEQFEELMTYAMPIFTSAFAQVEHGEPREEEQTITIDGTVYRVSEDFDNLNAGQWADIGDLIGRADYHEAFHIILAMVLRKEGDAGYINPKEVMRRAPIFQEKAKYKDIDRLLFFCSNGGERFNPFMRIYLVQTMGLTQAMKVIPLMTSQEPTSKKTGGIMGASLQFRSLGSSDQHSNKQEKET